MRKIIFIALISLSALLMGFNSNLFASEKPEIFVQLGHSGSIKDISTDGSNIASVSLRSSYPMCHQQRNS